MISENKHLVYTLQLAGINCTNCEAKIKDKLTKEVKNGLIKISVNVLQEKVNLVMNSEKILAECISILTGMGYKIVGEPLLLKSGDSSIRTVSFIYDISATSEEI